VDHANEHKEVADDAWAGPCGRRGLEAPDGSCICTALWSGPTCEGGEEYAFDENAGPARKPHGFLKNIGMAVNGLQGASREIRIHLPGKTPAWRYIAKAKGELLNLVPERDPVTERRYGACALVGNAGVLLNNKHTGEAIDAHEMVFRFNGAPTKGLEEFVGSRTHFRLVNSKWVDFREAEEMVLWNMRAPGSLDFYKERKSKNRSERFYIFSADFVNYIGQVAASMAKSFEGAEGEAFSSLEGGYTPTSGITGVIIALNLCHKVTIYGMQVSELQGYPYHYHNRCPQPFGARDLAEWLIFDRLVKEGLVTFNEPCVVECHGTEAECAECREQHPETYGEDVKAEALRIWEKGPLPDYCASRAELLRREKERLAKGGEPFTKEERDAIMRELAEKLKPASAAPAKEGRRANRGYKLLR